jgi:hypothetical protein
MKRKERRLLSFIHQSLSLNCKDDHGLWFLYSSSFYSLRGTRPNMQLSFLSVAGFATESHAILKMCTGPALIKNMHF